MASPAPEPQQAPAAGPSSLVGTSPLAFADGWLNQASLSLPEGVELAKAGDLVPGRAFDLSAESMAQLNLALTPGCLTLRVPAGVSVAEPLRLSFVAASGDVLASPRVADRDRRGCEPDADRDPHLA